MIECVGPECRTEVDYVDAVCDDCWDSRTVYRDELYGLWQTGWLLIEPARRPPDYSSHNLSVTTSRAPVDLAVMETLDAALTVVVDWANELRAEPVEQTDDRFGLAVTTLVRYDESLRGKEFAADYLYSLYRSHRELARLVRGPGGRVDGTCPDCDRAALIQRNEHVACLTCGARWLLAVFLTKRRRDVTQRKSL